MIVILFVAALMMPVTAFSMPPKTTVQHVRTVLERSDDHIVATQFLRLVGTGEDGKDTQNQYKIPLPQGAWGPRFPGEESNALAIDESSVVVKGPIPLQGRSVKYVFNMPIENERMILEQHFQSEVLNAQVISMWTEGDVKLTGEGFLDAEWGEASNGLQALMIGSKDVQDGTIRVRLLGLAPNAMDSRRNWTLFLSVLFLGLGFASWLRERASPRNERHEMSETARS